MPAAAHGELEAVPAREVDGIDNIGDATAARYRRTAAWGDAIKRAE